MQYELIKRNLFAIGMQAILVATCLALGTIAEVEADEIKLGPVVVLETTKGPIKIALYQYDAPITTSNFLDLVRSHFYDGTPFHRREEGFVIQGGSRTGKDGVVTFKKSGRTRSIPLEKPENLTHNKVGIVGMARREPPNSASCQFYITLKEALNLDQLPGYAAFGEVISDTNVLSQIQVGDKILRAFVEGAPEPATKLPPAPEGNAVGTEPEVPNQQKPPDTSVKDNSKSENSESKPASQSAKTSAQTNINTERNKQL